MLICGPRGCGKTNTLMHMLHQLLHYDKIYLFSKNLEQPKYQELLKTFQPISEEVGYQVIQTSNDEIPFLDELNDDNQKLVVFDDFVCERNQKPLIEYFIRSRHKNCCVIYLSQSYYLTPKDIRLNCSHFCILTLLVLMRLPECVGKLMFQSRSFWQLLVNLTALLTLIK